MCKRLLDRRAIVTGAGRGMGLAIAKALFSEGARVILTDIDEKGVVDAARQLDKKYDRALGKRVSVTDKEEIQNLVKEVKAHWGGIDILVNNAGGLWKPLTGWKRLKRKTGIWSWT